MADTGFRPPVRKKNAADHPKLQLRAPNSTGQIASLQWQLINNNPRIVVYTNDPNDTADFGKISANMDSPTMFALLRMVEEAAHSTTAYRSKIDNLNYTFPGGKRSDKPSVVSSTIVARDEEGQVSLMISAPRRPQIKFTFINPEFHHFIHTDGSVFTKAEASKLFALAYVDLMKGIYSSLLVSEYIEPPPKEPNAGGRGGYQNNRQGGGGGGYQNRGAQGGARAAAQAPELETEDVPW